jgi:hypothetical protein
VCDVIVGALSLAKCLWRASGTSNRSSEAVHDSHSDEGISASRGAYLFDQDHFRGRKTATGVQRGQWQAL